MAGKTTINKRLSIVSTVFLLVSLPIVIGGSFFFLKWNAEQEILKQAGLLASAMEAVRHYVVKYTTPVFEREVPGKFIVEGMADSFVNNVIFARIEKEHPDYYYKEAAINPLNLKNKADIFEEEKIKAFKTGWLKKEWRGFMDKPNGKFYAVMKPVRVRDQSCLSCHGDPDMAPDEVVKKYGKEHGFHWEVNDVVAVDAIYVPASVPFKRAMASLGVFAGAYSAFVIILIVFINMYTSRTIVKPIDEITEATNKISLGDFKHKLDIKTNDELETLAEAIDRMKVSFVKLIKMLKQKKG